MRRYLPLTAAILLYATPGHAQTTADFNLVNGTRHTITAVALSTQNDNRWFPISGEQIEAGDTTHITFDRPGFPCWQQLRIKFDDGVIDNFTEGFDLCQTSYIRIVTNEDGNDTAHYR
jgi:hypothetical protein